MNDVKQGPDISEADRKVLEFFAEHAFAPVEASACDLVRVKMTSRFELSEVTIQEGAMHASGRAALADAVMKAVNAAIREVAEANARRLSQYSQDLARQSHAPTSSPPNASTQRDST